MKIKNNYTIKTNFKGQTMEKSMKDIAKEAANKLYTKSRLEITQEGKFNTIYECFVDKNDKYILYVSPSADKNSPDERVLSVAYEIEEEENMISMVLKRGNKQEILDFLGNEKNIPKILSSAEFAYKKHLNS